MKVWGESSIPSLLPLPSPAAVASFYRRGPYGAIQCADLGRGATPRGSNVMQTLARLSTMRTRGDIYAA